MMLLIPQVTLLWDLFNNELHVEYEGKSYGPFYPADGPIPFGRYRTFKKSKKEERADHIGPAGAFEQKLTVLNSI